jgi:hypothetical protein
VGGEDHEGAVEVVDVRVRHPAQRQAAAVCERGPAAAQPALDASQRWMPAALLLGMTVCGCRLCQQSKQG